METPVTQTLTDGTVVVLDIHPDTRELIIGVGNPLTLKVELLTFDRDGNPR